MLFFWDKQPILYIFLTCCIGSLAVLTVAFLLFYFSEDQRTSRRYLNRFGELESAFSAILVPQGFEKKTLPDTYAVFSKGFLVVNFGYIWQDRIFHLEVRGKNSAKNFQIDSSNLNIDEFKNAAITKLNQWLGE